MSTDTIQIGPPSSEARAVVILIHGRGSSGHSIAGLAEAVGRPEAGWIAPTATNGAWYPRRFLVPLEENAPWLEESLERIDWLFRAVEEAGVPSERTALTGFSQGACLALEYAIRHPRRYGFVAALSGALIGPLELARTPVDLGETPVLLGCADHDAHIPAPFVDHSERVLIEANAAVTRQRFPGSTHSVFPEEVAWIERVIDTLLIPR